MTVAFENCRFDDDDGGTIFAMDLQNKMKMTPAQFVVQKLGLVGGVFQPEMAHVGSTIDCFKADREFGLA